MLPPVAPLPVPPAWEQGAQGPGPRPRWGFKRKCSCRAPGALQLEAPFSEASSLEGHPAPSERLTASDPALFQTLCHLPSSSHGPVRLGAWSWLGPDAS